MNTLTHWKQLHAANPYADFPIYGYKLDMQGWNSNDPIFEELILETKPALIVEVGVWKGASTIHMGKILNKHGMSNAHILAVDTWLGSLEFWTKRDDPERYQALKCVNGYPTVYRQFIANVIQMGLHDKVIPFPNTSQIAAGWMGNAGFKADLVYLDASHEVDDIRNDLFEWARVIRPGGVLSGDDWGTWEGVRVAVDDYCAIHDFKVDLRGNKWVIRL